jgi:iron complex transport system permease protein
VYRVLGRHLIGVGAPVDPIVDRIVWQLRLPRALLACLVGGGLSIIGVAMQTLVRNPLAEPYILGISSGASAGASFFYLGFLPPLLSKTLTMPLAAFLGGLASIAIVYLVARDGPRVSVARLLLAGVAMSALMASLTSFVTFSSPEPDKLRAVLFWLLGSLNGTRWEQLPLPALTTGLGLGTLLLLARPLDAMLVGEEPAQSLGMPVEALKRGLIVLAALVTGTLVAVSGAIGFVGLIVPHAVRLLVGVPHRRLVPLSFLAGAIFLCWADLAARTILPAQELPVGVLTALCGVPFFLVLLRRRAYHFGSNP